MAISYSPNDVFMVQRNAENTAFLETVLRSTPNSVVVFDPNSILVTVATKSFSDAMVSQSLRDFTASVAAAAFISDFATSASNASFANFALSSSNANLSSFAFSASYLNIGANIYLSQSYLQSDINASEPPFTPGLLFWDKVSGTYTIDTDVPGVDIQIGQKQFIRAVGGEFIPQGSAVYISGSSTIPFFNTFSSSISESFTNSFSSSTINYFFSSSLSSSISSSFSGSTTSSLSSSISSSIISYFVTSSIDGIPIVYLAIADGTGLKSDVIGIAPVDMSTSEEGFVFVR